MFTVFIKPLSNHMPSPITPPIIRVSMTWRARKEYQYVVHGDNFLIMCQGVRLRRSWAGGDGYFVDGFVIKNYQLSNKISPVYKATSVTIRTHLLRHTFYLIKARELQSNSQNWIAELVCYLPSLSIVNTFPSSYVWQNNVWINKV